MLEKLVSRQSLYSQIKGFTSNLITNIKTSLHTIFNNGENIDALAKHDLNANKIILLKVSKLEKYALFLYQNNDLLFLNLTARSIILY